MLRLLRASLAGPALGTLALAAILVLLQRPAPLFVNVGAGDDELARGFRAWERDGLRASGETMFRWALDGARVELPIRIRSGSLTARLRLNLAELRGDGLERGDAALVAFVGLLQPLLEAADLALALDHHRRE